MRQGDMITIGMAFVELRRSFHGMRVACPRTACIHTAGERELVTRQSFDSFITSLKMDSRFYRCNRGVVINLEHAVDFDGTGFRLDSGNNVPVSRKLLKNARQTFMEFLFQRRS